jgi:hypothetical protein
MVFNLWWKDIYYDTPEFDIKDITWEFREYMYRDNDFYRTYIRDIKNMIKEEKVRPGRLVVKFPALKKFHIHAT